jgi:hypothetical protein
LILAIHHLVDLIQTAMLDTEILLDVLVNQDMLVCLQIADQNALPIRNVQAIWRVNKKNVEIHVLELVHLMPIVK